MRDRLSEKLQSMIAERLFIGDGLKKTKDEIEAEQLEENEIQNRKERKKYAGRTFWFIVAFVVTILTFVGLDASGLWDIDSGTEWGLIGSLSSTVVGLYYLVMKYLFNVSKK